MTAPATLPVPAPALDAAPAPVVDFTSAARALLEHLHRRIGMDTWAIARRDEEDYVVLAALDAGEVGLAAGDVMAWCDTFCAAVVAGDAPRFSTRVEQVPAWVHARQATGFAWRSYLSVPLRGPDGSVLGSLCAGAHEQLDVGLEQAVGEVELAADLLGTLLAYEVRLEHEARRAERAEAAAERDALTGVGNRRAWNAALAAEEARARRLGSSASVLVMDLDALKETNDTHGHEAGDALLVRAAQVLGEQLRAVDLVVRLGGDEFAALLPDVGSAAAGEVLARLQAGLRLARVHASLGVATRRAASGLEAAWHRADAAMYADKAARAGQAALTAAAASARASTNTSAGTAGRSSTAGAAGTDLVDAQTSTAVGAAGGGDASAAGGEEDERSAPGTAKTVGASVRLEESVLAERIEHLLEAARAQLGMDAVVLAHFDGDSWRLRHTASAQGVRDPRGFACERGDTYCQRLLDGHLHAVIADTRADAATASLDITRELDIGAYIGVPVHLTDGTLYGTVCALASSAQPDLRPRDAGVLEMLATALSAPVSAEVRQRQRRRQVLAHLEHLARSGGPRPVYQPIFDLRTGVPIGCEALSRFPDDAADSSFTGGPQAWFARAAGIGAGTQLELAALGAALHQRPDTAELLFLNVSPALAASPALARALHGQELRTIVVEITEHEQVQDYPTLLRHLSRLRAQGLRMAIDDAGAGFASMRHVLALAPEFIKLDMSLIRGIHTDSTRQALTASLATFAQRTRAHLIAEGIESTEELHCLRELGITHGQGYHLGRPAAASMR